MIRACSHYKNMQICESDFRRFKEVTTYAVCLWQTSQFSRSENAMVCLKTHKEELTQKGGNIGRKYACLLV